MENNFSDISFERQIDKANQKMHITATNGEKRNVSWADTVIRSSYLNGRLVRTMTVQGIGTEPNYRRAGLVRGSLEAAFEYAAAEGCEVSLLHPFSFAFYRKFGYEKVSNHVFLEFPMTALDYVPRCPEFVRADSEARLDGAAEVYNKFAAGRNIMFPRTGGRFQRNGERQTWLRLGRDGSPTAYVILENEKYFSVNRMASVNLHVHELGYTCPAGLRDILGFLRMFEGDLESVKVHDIGMCPEADFALRHYTHTKYTVIPDIMARVHDTRAVLAGNPYPAEPGHFTVSVVEPLESNRKYGLTEGVFEVEYGGGKSSVTRLDGGHAFDVRTDVSAFTQIVYGYESLTAQTAQYMYNVEVAEGRGACDFFRAFPKRPGGLFEHF